MRTFRSFLCSFLFIVCFFYPINTHAQGQSLIVILIPSLALEDLTRSPFLYSLSQKSSVGLMNSAGKEKTINSAYLTLGAGKKTSSLKLNVFGLQNTEQIEKVKAPDLYERYLGFSADKKDIVVPYYEALLPINTPDVKPGRLASTLTKHHIPLLFMGNQDLPDLLIRPGTLFAMDEQGSIQKGYVDKRTYKVSGYSPTYFSTDYSFLLAQMQEFLAHQEGLVILDLGDLARLDSYSPYLSEARFKFFRTQLLHEMESFLGQLLSWIEKQKANLLVVTPYPDKNSSSWGNTLTPLIFYQPGEEQSSILTSSSTKRSGIISNLDIAPTILNFFELKEKNWLGYPLEKLSHSENVLFLKEIYQQIVTNYHQRPLLLKTYVIIQIVLVLSTILLILLRHPLLRFLSPFLLALTSGPLLFLILSLLPTWSLAGRIFALILSASAIVFLLEKKVTVMPRLTVLYLLTVFFLMLDLFLGAPLMKNSLLGYDPISGARYYGIGNEYLGVLLGSSLIGFTMLLDIVTKRFALSKTLILTGTVVFFSMITLLVASPKWGTNVGGTITFLFCSLLLIVLLTKKNIRILTLVATACLTVLTLSLLFYLDYKRPMEVQSHIGLTTRTIKENGLAALMPIMSRKISMNWSLIHYSIWSRVFITFLGSIAFLLYRPIGLLQKIFNFNPYLQAGFLTGILGSFLVLLVNDSGIVAAATSMIYIAPTLLYLIAKELALVRE